MSYYICVLSSGTELDFDKKCTHITWDSDMFRALDEKGKCLAIIPIINVESFLLKQEE